MELLRGRRWAIVHCTEPLMHALAAAGFEAGEAVRAVRLLTWSTLGFTYSRQSNCIFQLTFVHK